MRILAAALMLALTLTAVPALAQTDAEVDARIDMVLGDHAPYRAAFDALQKATAYLDADAFAALVSYPITVPVEGEETTIADAAAFAGQFQGILTTEIASAITEQKWQDVFVNDQGVMIGNGQVWLNGICKDDACAAFDVKVVTIQSTSN